MIESFANETTCKLFRGEQLSRKEAKGMGDLNIIRAFERLAILNRSDEKSLLLTPFLHYHRLKGTSLYSIDAESRKSKWRITFAWDNEEKTDVRLVKIENTH